MAVKCEDFGWALYLLIIVIAPFGSMIYLLSITNDSFYQRTAIAWMCCHVLFKTFSFWTRFDIKERIIIVGTTGCTYFYFCLALAIYGIVIVSKPGTYFSDKRFWTLTLFTLIVDSIVTCILSPCFMTYDSLKNGLAIGQWTEAVTSSLNTNVTQRNLRPTHPGHVTIHLPPTPQIVIHGFYATCSVCHENFKDGEPTKELLCNHPFHPNCIDPWLANNDSCPTCRLKVK